MTLPHSAWETVTLPHSGWETVTLPPSGWGPSAYKHVLCAYLAHLWECLKLVEAFDGAEKLQTDAGGDDEQTHSEQDEAAQLTTWTKNLQKKSRAHPQMVCPLLWHCCISTVYSKAYAPSSRSLPTSEMPWSASHTAKPVTKRSGTLVCHCAMKERIIIIFSQAFHLHW